MSIWKLFNLVREHGGRSERKCTQGKPDLTMLVKRTCLKFYKRVVRKRIVML